MCNKDIRLYEMSLPIKLAGQLDQLACKLNISRGEVMARALLLLSLAIDADKVSLIKNSKITNVIVK